MASDVPSPENTTPPASAPGPGPDAAAFRVGGLNPLTTVEWDGRLCIVIFAQGCPWRCRYCHNTSLMLPDGKLIPWPEVLSLLHKRQGLADGVVFSGGEPTAQPALPAAISVARELGYQVALHTNGCNPNMLKQLLKDGLLDYVAMDVKAAFSRYEQVTQIRGSGRKAQQSVTALLKSGVPCEFRTTYHSELITENELLEVGEDLRWRGVKRYFIQKYRIEGSGDMPLALSPSKDLSKRLLRKLEGMFEEFGVRG